MTNRYPHLTDATAFPDVSTVAPYAQYANDFDYTRWTPGTTITVCSVPWDGVRNIVDFKTDEARDAWFASADGHRETLRTEMHLLPDGVVKLPIPFAAMSRYNYVFVSYPTPTSPADPLERADGPRTHAWGFFVDSVRQLAPSTTECSLRLDSWTTFGNHVSFTHCQLERGHAPMAASPLDDYLGNPIEHSALLLTPDESFGPDAAIVRHHEFHPWTAGTKLVMFASTVSPIQLDDMGRATEWSDTEIPTTPTYTDTTDRWGYQYKVDGYEWRLGNMDYSNLDTPTTPFHGDIIPNGVFQYVVEATSATDLFEAIVKYMPQFMQTIRGMWVVPSDMASKGKPHTVGTVTLYEAAPVNDMPDIHVALTRDMFGYPADYADITKLYTFPYAALELSDNDGTTVTVRVENTGDLTLHRRVALAYPYLKAQAFLTGVDGTGATTYEWRDMGGNAHTGTMWDTAFADFMASYDIPTYALFMDGYTDHAFRSQTLDADAERLKALNGYHKAMRSTNTAYENTKDQLNVNYGNTVRSADNTLANAIRTADNIQTNTNDSAQTTQENTNRGIETARANAKRSNTTGRSNASVSNTSAKSIGDLNAATALTNGNASAKTGLDNALAAAYAGNQNALRSNVTEYNNTLSSTAAMVSNTKDQNQASLDETDKNNSWDLKRRNTNKAFTNNSAYYTNKLSNNNLESDIDMQNETLVVKVVNDVMSAASSALGAVTGSGGMSSAGKHAAGPSVSGVGAVGVATAVVGGLTAVGSDIALNHIAKNNMTDKQFNAVTFTNENADSTNRVYDSMTRYGNLQRNDLTEIGNRLNLNIANRNHDTTNSNAANSKKTNDANAKRTYAMQQANANRSYDTSVTNNERSNTTALSNNQTTFNTAEANAQRTLETGEANAEASRQTGLTNSEQSRQVAARTAQRSRDTGVTNSTNDRTTNVTNAGKSRDVGLNNALESREASEFAAKTDLEQARTLKEIAYRSNATSGPVSTGSYAGDPTPDLFAYRGVTVRVRTQSDSAIRRAGDRFLRYGYAYDGAWEVATLTVMPKYTYWKMSEVWLDSDTDIMEQARNDIRDTFEAGVTVWTDPAYIGRTGIHDNR